MANPYPSLLRTNRNFRLLYIGQTVSQLGDWFNSVAVFALLLDLTGSATAVAWMMIVQFMPVAVFGPMAGVIVDRVDRRRLMIVTDVLRGVVVLWTAAGAAPRSSVDRVRRHGGRRRRTGFFRTSAYGDDPQRHIGRGTDARQRVVERHLVGHARPRRFDRRTGDRCAGRNAAFVVNAISFFASAYFIAQTRFQSRPPPAPPLIGFLALTGIRDLLEGLRYVRHRSHVAALMFVKAGWGLAGGILLLLTIFGQRVFPVGGSTAAGIGVLYGARGVGAAMGPIALRWILGQSPRTLRRAIGPAYFMVGFFYVALAWAPNLPIAVFCVFCAHFGGSILWVFSTVLLQMEVPDRFRGRVFAAELALVTLMSSISSYWTGYELDRAGWSPRTMAFALGRDVLRAWHVVADHSLALA